jgi:hypothetical protein
MDEFISAISSVGFPIVAFLLMYLQSTKTIKENTKAINELILLIKK